MKNNLIKFFPEEKNILAFTTTREKGDFRHNISAVYNLLKDLGFSGVKVAMPELVHSDNVFEAKKNNFSPNNLIKATDSILAREKDIFLAITFADCFPIFIFNKDKKEIGIIHGGWRSVSAKIIEKTIKKFPRKDRKNIKIVIGPGINFEHYEFDLEVAQKNFSAYPKRIIKSEKINKGYLDLKGIIKDKLQKAGITEKNIFDCGINTFTDKRFFSARKDKFSSNNVKACAAVIGVVE